MHRRLLLALLLTFVACPSVAPASPSVIDSLAIADRYWGEHPCAGAVFVSIDPALIERGRHGEATGVSWTGTEWRRVSCDIAIAPNEGCETILHEVGHLVHGADHTGPLSPNALARAVRRVCRPPRQHRADLRADILRSLPRQAKWRLSCTPTRPRMRCRARARGWTDRRFHASITATGMTWGVVHARGIAK